MATGTAGADGSRVARVTASASVRDGAVTLTCANLSDDEGEEVFVRLPGLKDVSGRILAGAPADHNDFEASPVAARPFADFEEAQGGLRLRLPPCSVAALTLK